MRSDQQLRACENARTGLACRKKGDYEARFYLAPASRSSPFAFQAKSFQQVSPLLLAGRPWSAVTGIWTNGDRVREARVFQATFSRNLIPPPLRRWSSESEKIRPVEWRLPQGEDHAGMQGRFSFPMCVKQFSAGSICSLG